MLRNLAHDARAIQKTNHSATWAARSFDANTKDIRAASNRIWNGPIQISIRPKFSISTKDKVFAMGSCFAREIEEALSADGVDVVTLCDRELFTNPLLSLPDNKKSLPQFIRPRAYLNRYNTMSLYREFCHLLGRDDALAEGQLLYFADRMAVADLHYSQALPQVSKDLALERRQVVRSYFSDRMGECSVFIVTLGLAEAWYDTVEDRYLNNTPGPRVMAAYNDRLEVRLTDYATNLAALEDMYDLLSSVFSGRFKLIVTVSPVPLEKTFFEQDVITTNTYSKSMLRCVAHQFANQHDNADYFPSYEIVMYTPPSDAWGWDYRHVKPELVRHITNTFCQNYMRD